MSKRPLYRTTMDAIHARVVARLKAQPTDALLKECPECGMRFDTRLFLKCPGCRAAKGDTL